MTAHQADRPQWIVEYLTVKPSATVRELMEAVGLASTAAVHHHLRKLERRGVIERATCDECGHASWKVKAA